MAPTVSHCESSDIPELARIYYAVFSKLPIYRVMYSGADPDSIIEKYEMFFRKGIEEQANSTASRKVHYLKIIDPDCQEIMSYIIWISIPKSYNGAEDPQTSVEGSPAGSNLPVAHEYKRVVKNVRGEDEERKGPHCLLSLLGTHPSYERRGAASKLVKWAFDRADAEQLPCYVNSSVTAHALYGRLGFRDVGEMQVDLDEFECGKGLGLQRWFAMKREPVRS